MSAQDDFDSKLEFSFIANLKASIVQSFTVRLLFIYRTCQMKLSTLKDRRGKNNYHSK